MPAPSLVVKEVAVTKTMKSNAPFTTLTGYVSRYTTWSFELRNSHHSTVSSCAVCCTCFNMRNVWPTTVKLSVLSVAETFAGTLVLDVASGAEAGGVNTSFLGGSGAGAWAGGDASGVWEAGPTIAPVTARAGAALSLRLHALRDRLTAVTRTVATRILM